MPKQPAIYIMASARNGTLYTGVTTNLRRRVAQHREGQTPGFTSQYRCFILVYYELHPDITAAITREKQRKGGSRFKKLKLIESTNPEWQDLYDTLSPTNPASPPPACENLALQAPPAPLPGAQI
jgi:predicted GIY-YIG superfamily endonuclease